MPDRSLLLVSETFPDRPAFDTAVSRAILLRVAGGELPDTVRVGRPGAMVAFGRQDVSSRGYRSAVCAARAGGFEAIERLAGGRAAVFHERTLALALAIRDADPWGRTHERFERLATIVAEALTALGVDARVGEVPGEYCPGAYSVNARGRSKLAGIGQRLVRGGAHLGGVVVIGGSDRVRDVLLPVYEALELAWDPATAGSVEDELGDVAPEDVEAAVNERLAACYELRPMELDARTLELARQLEREHLAPRFERPRSAFRS
jgi:lipoate-protein ligase A